MVGGNIEENVDVLAYITLRFYSPLCLPYAYSKGTETNSIITD